MSKEERRTRAELVSGIAVRLDARSELVEAGRVGAREEAAGDRGTDVVALAGDERRVTHLDDGDNVLRLVRRELAFLD